MQYDASIIVKKIADEIGGRECIQKKMVEY